VSFAVYRRIDFFRPRLEQAGIVVHTLPKRGRLDPAFPARLRRWIASERPDVVHAFLPLPTIWTALARRGLRGHEVRWIAGERSSPEANVGRVLAWALRRVYPRFDAVTANSRPAAEILIARFGVPTDRVHYLPNGIDLAEWDRRAGRPTPFAFEPGRFHLGLVGRISEEKNHRLLLEALTHLDPEVRSGLRCWFVGAEDGRADFIEAVRREVTARGLAEVVRMLPPTPELPALMARLDALVLPSRYEGFPNVVLEAMASRLPVVASAVGDVPSLVEPGRSGFVVPPGDAAALAARLSELFERTDGERREMGSAARAIVEARYGIEWIARAHLELYRRLAGKLPGDAADPGLG